MVSTGQVDKRGHTLDCSGFVISGAIKLNADNKIVKFNKPTELAYAA